MLHEHLILIPWLVILFNNNKNKLKTLNLYKPYNPINFNYYNLYNLIIIILAYLRCFKISVSMYWSCIMLILIFGGYLNCYCFTLVLWSILQEPKEVMEIDGVSSKEEIGHDVQSRRELCCKNLKFNVSTPSLGSSSGDV